MLQRKSYVRRSRKGNLVTVVREHYLRDDVRSGLQRVTPDQRTGFATADAWLGVPDASFPYFLLPDASVAIDHIDLLEHKTSTHIILLQSVLQSVRLKNRAVYERLRELADSAAQTDVAADGRDKEEGGSCSSLGHRRFVYVFSNEHHRATYAEPRPNESEEEREIRAVQVAAFWYFKQIPKPHQLLVLSELTPVHQLLSGLGMMAKSAHEYATLQSQTFPELLDLVGILPTANKELSDGTTTQAAPDTTSLFPAYLPEAKVEAGFRNGTLHRGVFHASDEDPMCGYVVVSRTLQSRSRQLLRVRQTLAPTLATIAGGTAAMVAAAHQAAWNEEHFHEQLLVRGRKLVNRAMEGDIVAVRVLPTESWLRPSNRLASRMDQVEKEEVGEAEEDQVEEGEVEPTGCIVSILRRGWRPYTGCLLPPQTEHKEKNLKKSKQKKNQTFAAAHHQELYFVSRDRRIPKIRVRAHAPQKLLGRVLVVRVDGWPADSPLPVGHYVRDLGPIGDRETETLSVLVQHGIRYEQFNDRVLACLPNDPGKKQHDPLDSDRQAHNGIQPSEVLIDDELLRVRADLRALCVLSIDPPGCTDIDDALHARMLPSGLLEVGVHIADVTHYLESGSAMDQEAAARGSSVYLCDRRIDMLPGLLGTNLCSLHGGVTRLAFSVVWELEPDTATVRSVRFAKSIIRSRKAFTYNQAQKIIDDTARKDEIATSLRHLQGAADLLREARRQRGALTLASPEVRFRTAEETRDPIDVELYDHVDTHHLVEEFMLLANVSVGHQILRAFPNCALLRRHPPPSPSRFEQLVQAAGSAGVKLDVSDSKSLCASLDAAHVKGNDYFNTLLRIMTTRCMTQAVYFCSGSLSRDEFIHYGLAAPVYTHFTSPIRRYADVVVHRLLAASLGVLPLADGLSRESVVRRLCAQLNRGHRRAQHAGRASIQLFTRIYFRNHAAERCEAHIMAVRRDGVQVLVPKYGIEGSIRLNDYGYEAQEHALFSSDRSRVLRLFDRIMVRVSVRDTVCGDELELELCEPNKTVSKKSNVTALSPQNQSTLLQKRKKRNTATKALSKKKSRKNFT